MSGAASRCSSRVRPPDHRFDARQVVALIDAELARTGFRLPDSTTGRRLRLIRTQERCSLLAADRLFTAIRRPDLMSLLEETIEQHEPL